MRFSDYAYAFLTVYICGFRITYMCLTRYSICDALHIRNIYCTYVLHLDLDKSEIRGTFVTKYEGSAIGR